MDIFYPLQIFADTVTYQWLNIAKPSHLGSAFNFFVYDTVKIFILLIVINYIMAIIRYYLPIEKIRDVLVQRKWYGFDYFLSSLFGVITPFCSCSSIPLFVGFLSARVPLGIALAFLITSPLSSGTSIALFMGIFGLKITFLYVLVGMLIGMGGGYILGKIRTEDAIEASILTIIAVNKKPAHTPNRKYRALTLLGHFWQEGWSLTRKILPYVIFGVALGSLIHGYVPAGFFEQFLKSGDWWSVPLATVVAIPLYSNDVGVIPVMQALITKGVPLGTALAFITATVGLSLPEALILKRIMKTKMLILFYGVVTIGILIMGYAFNILL